MKRSPCLLTFILFVPAFFMALTCLCIGVDPHNLPVGVLNLEDCSDFNSTICSPSSLSCYYLEALNHSQSVHLVPFQDSLAMRLAAGRAEVRATLTIQANFSQSVLKQFLTEELYSAYSLFYGSGEEVESGEKIFLSLDNSDKLVLMLIKKIMGDAILTFSRVLTKACETMLPGQ